MTPKESMIVPVNMEGINPVVVLWLISGPGSELDKKSYVIYRVIFSFWKIVVASAEKGDVDVKGKERVMLS